MIARDLGEYDADRLSTEKRLKAIRKRTRDRDDSELFAAWLTSTNKVLRQRGLLAHGMFVHYATDDGVQQGFTTPREHAPLSVDLDRLDALVRRAEELAEHASVLGTQIVREDIMAADPTWFDRHPDPWTPPEFLGPRTDGGRHNKP